MDDPGLLLTLGMALSVCIGAVSQRATGMGFALLSAPFLVLVLGPLQGILAVNAASVLANSLILVQVWRDVELAAREAAGPDGGGGRPARRRRRRAAAGGAADHRGQPPGRARARRHDPAAGPHGASVGRAGSVGRLRLGLHGRHRGCGRARRGGLCPRHGLGASPFRRHPRSCTGWCSASSRSPPSVLCRPSSPRAGSHCWSRCSSASWWRSSLASHRRRLRDARRRLHRDGWSPPRSGARRSRRPLRALRRIAAWPSALSAVQPSAVRSPADDEAPASSRRRRG